MRVAPALATVALAAGSVAVTGAPATADLITRCVGEGGAVTVPGDLVVPAGTSCTLTGTVVQGDVRVARGADLVVTDGTLEGDVVIAEDAYLDALGTAIVGSVTNRAGYGAYLETSQVRQNYTARGNDAYSPFLWAANATVDGQVDVVAGAVLLEGSTVGGDVRGTQGEYTDVIDSTLLNDLTVRDNEYGAVFCESEVDGDASYRGNQYGLQLGGPGPLGACDDIGYWGGNLDISNNTGGVQLSDNIVRGDLSGTGNDPAPTGENNRIRGVASGQFVDLQPTPADAPTPKVRSLSVAADGLSPAEAPTKLVAPQDHKTELGIEREKRRANAETEAAQAGPANL